MYFWRLNKEVSIEFSEFVICGCYVWCREISCRSGYPSSSHPKTMFFLGPREIPLAWNWIDQTNIWNTRLLVRCPKSFISKSSANSFRIAALKHSFSGMKSPGKKYMTASKFLQLPEVISNITVVMVLIKNIKNGFSSKRCDGHPCPTSALNYNFMKNTDQQRCLIPGLNIILLFYFVFACSLEQIPSLKLTKGTNKNDLSPCIIILNDKYLMAQPSGLTWLTTNRTFDFAFLSWLKPSEFFTDAGG